MLSIRSPIVASDIYIATALSPGHPVFKLEGFGDDKGKIDALVIKLEAAQAPANVGAAAALMTIVDRSARTEVLNPMEIQQLKLWAGGSELPDVEALRTANALDSQLKIQGTWVKMEVKQLTMLDSAVKKRLDPNNPDKADVRFIAKALKDRGGLEKLGEIIAADLFNHNTDRFGPPFDLNPGQGPGGIPLQAIYNVGNVFIACDGKGRGKPIGLDNFDPAGEFKDISSAYLDQNRWSGMLLHPSKKADRETFAGLIITDLEALLGPRNRKIPFGTQKRLGNARKVRLRHGMESGAKKLKKGIASWQRRNPNHQLYSNISARVGALGW